MKWLLHNFTHPDGSLLLGTLHAFLPVWDAVLGTMWCLGEEVSSQSGSFSMLEVVPKDPSGVLSSPHFVPVVTVSAFSFLSLLHAPHVVHIKGFGKSPGWEAGG